MNMMNTKQHTKGSWRTGIVCFLTAGWLLLLAGCADDSREIKQLLQRPPYAGLTDSIKRFPDDVTLYVQRGTLLSQNNQHELATSDYRDAWNKAPNETNALIYVSNLLLVNKPQEAVSMLKSCISKFPANPEFPRRLSEVYAQTGKTKEALEIYDKMLATDSSNFEAWYERGTLLNRLGDTAAGIQAIEYSYALQPVNYIGYVLANLYAYTQNPKTIELCDELIRRDSSDTQIDAFFIKGTYYSDTKQYAQAIAQFDACIKRDWKFTDAYIEKGIVLFEQRQFDAALEVFTMATTVSNSSADAYFWMARCYEAKNNKQLAYENYAKALALDRGFVEARKGIERTKE